MFGFESFGEKVTIMYGSSSQFSWGGDSMTTKGKENKVKDISKTKKQPDLPSFSKTLQSVLDKGQSITIEGTNVVRVPFGIRKPLRQRPQRPDHWATIVLPFQPDGSPTPPPQAA